MGKKRKQDIALTKRERKQLKAKTCICPGISKGSNCHTTPLQKTVARRNRSHNMKEYGNVLKSWNNKGKV